MVFFQNDIRFLLRRAGYLNRSTAWTGRGDVGGLAAPSDQISAAAGRTAPCRRGPRSSPPSTATSRSAVIPIEHVGRPRSSTRRRTARNAGPGRLGAAVGRADGHQPVDVAARRRRPRATRPATSSERAAALARLAGRVDLDEDARTRRPAGDLVDERAAGRPSPTRRTSAGELAHLVRLQPPDEVHGEHRGRGHGGGLGEQLLGVVLADRAAAGGRRRGDGVGAEALGDGDDRDAVADAGARMRRQVGRRGRRRRRPSAQERRDVEVVVVVVVERDRARPRRTAR